MIRLRTYLKPYIGMMTITILFVFAQAMCDLTLPDYMAKIVDKGIISGNKHYILKTGMTMVSISLLSVGCNIVMGYFGCKIAAGSCQKLRCAIFSKVQNFTNDELDQFSTASLITRTTNDVSQIQQLIPVAIKILFYAPIIGIGGIIRALSKSASLSQVIAVAVLFISGILITLFVVSEPRYKVIQHLVDRLNLVSRENLIGMLIVRAFNSQEFEEDRFEQVNKSLSSTNLFVNRLSGILNPAITFIMNITLVGVMWIGSRQVSAFKIDIGDMMAFIQYTTQIIMAFLMASMMFTMLPKADVSANRIADVLEMRSHMVDPDAGADFSPKFNPTIEFKNVCFNYAGGEADALNNVSFTAKPGETTAIIGSTGSGKTTLVNLIPRFYDITQGQILINGQNICSVSRHNLRAKIGYVPQKSVLFSGTINSNLRYADQNAVVETIEHAAEVAQAMDFIKIRTEGLETAISQGGENMSGGQKQRLSIARALVKKAPIYIFDDSFSALDYKTDVALRSALKKDTMQSTVIMVAQRVSTIMYAEQIIVLDQGKIVGKGTHRQLLESCEVYYEIASSQMSKEELLK